jgi:hypothetical protein
LTKVKGWTFGYHTLSSIHAHSQINRHGQHSLEHFRWAFEYRVGSPNSSYKQWLKLSGKWLYIFISSRDNCNNISASTRWPSSSKWWINKLQRVSALPGGDQ